MLCNKNSMDILMKCKEGISAKIGGYTNLKSD